MIGLTNRSLGAVALSCFFVNAIGAGWLSHWAHGLWACHVATAVLGFGLLIGCSSLAAMGALCLTVGTPLWGLDVVCGAPISPTSVYSHVLGLLVSAIFIHRETHLQCWPHGSWWKTLLWLGLLQGLTRLLTPAEQNVNAAFQVYRSVASYLPSYLVYWLVLLFAGGTVLWLIEQAILLLQRKRVRLHSPHPIAIAPTAIPASQSQATCSLSVNIEGETSSIEIASTIAPLL